MREQQTNQEIRILGYCELGESELLAMFHAEGPECLRNLRGEYTLVIENSDGIYVIVSPFGALRYFYTVQNGKLYHSDKLVEIIEDSGLAWEWDWQALGDVCRMEHLTENTSLHRHIKKVPAGSIFHFKDGTLTLDSRLWVDSIEPGEPDPEEALNVLNEEVAFWAGDTPFISFSGGLDSRVMLSSLLKQGIKPNLMTRGTDESFDVVVTRQIASKFGLNHDVSNFDMDDFFQHASDISALTNGTMTARHWHTYIYPLNSGIGKDNVFFAGTLGEFVRGYPFDKGFISKISDKFPGPSLSKFWMTKLTRHPTFTDEELNGVTPELKAQLDDNGTHEQVRRLSNLCHGKFLSGLRRFYIEQRIPSFTGNGVKMYLASTSWVSPFHSRKWINHVWRLGDRWKLGDNWHRYAVQKNFPELLAFQERNGSAEGRIVPRAPFLYWTPMKKRFRVPKDNNLSESWYRTDRISDFVIENADEIDDIIDRETVKNILASHLEGTNRSRSVAFLLTMIFWKLEVKKVISIAS